VKLQFHWDRLGSSNEESSCWVRVVQVWAGGQWGGIHIPRIGQEVIVEFLEGDPDRPLVTGRVYNGDSMPPYSLPGNQTQSGIKSRSTKKGTAENYNELLFEDKKGQEQIRLHAERDLNEVVEVDHTVRIGGNERIEIRGNQTVSIQGAPVQGGGQIGCQVSITGDWKVDVSNTISIQAPTSITLTCGGSSVKLEPGRISLVAGDGATLVLDANAALKAKEISADADKEVRLAGAAGTARANSQGVQIQGPVVKLN
jgi:type VI secretion system secreted protein VgrG